VRALQGRLEVATGNKLLAQISDDTNADGWFRRYRILRARFVAIEQVACEIRGVESELQQSARRCGRSGHSLRSSTVDPIPTLPATRFAIPNTFPQAVPDLRRKKHVLN
jgi:hypothetical protein